MLLSAALPQHGPTPNPQQKKKMEEAGPLIYDAYNLFQSGSQNVEAAGEQLKLGLHTESASSNLASGEMLMQQGLDDLKKGKKMKDDAEAKQRTLQETIGIVKQKVRSSHISLISVESMK